MANSVNQVRQLYVAKEFKSPKVATTDNAGSISVTSDTAKNHVYFQYIGAGGLTRSDLIPIKNITYAKATDANALAYNLTRFKLTLDSTVNSGNPIAGQDYLLRIAFRNYVGLSEEDQYFKYGVVRATTGMTPSTFYKNMALSLVKNFSRETNKMLRFYLETGGTDPAVVNGSPTEVTTLTTAASLSGTYTGLVIEEAPQDWILGVFEQLPVYFTLQPDTVVSSGDSLIWGVVNKVTSVSKIENGKKVADMEYFYMGERGDIYRMVGFPHVINTAYLVDPSLKYNIIDLGYNHQDGGEGVQKSEKVITLVVPKIGATNSVSNVLTNSIITAINTATGLSISLLSVA